MHVLQETIQKAQDFRVGAPSRSSRGESAVVELSGVSRPAGGTGGDILEILPAGEGRVLLYVADAIGKGRRASLLRLRVRSALHASMARASRVGDLCEKLNRSLCGQFCNGEFATVFCAILDTRSARLTYTRAGHTPALLVRHDGSIVRLMEGGGILGAFRSLSYGQGEVELRAGDRLVLYTDGVTEATDAEGQELGEEGLAGWIERHRGLDARGLRRTLMAALDRFSCGRLRDDVTVGVLAVDPVS